MEIITDFLRISLGLNEIIHVKCLSQAYLLISADKCQPFKYCAHHRQHNVSGLKER